MTLHDLDAILHDAATYYRTPAGLAQVAWRADLQGALDEARRVVR